MLTRNNARKMPPETRGIPFSVLFLGGSRRAAPGAENRAGESPPQKSYAKGSGLGGAVVSPEKESGVMLVTPLSTRSQSLPGASDCHPPPW